MSESKEKGGCKSGCCSPQPKIEPKPEPEPEVQKNNDSCASGCCAGDKTSKTVEEDDCCKPSIEEDGCQSDDECCKPAKPIEDSGCQDGCCKPKEKPSTVVDTCCQPTTSITAPACSSGCCGPKDGQDDKDSCCEPAESIADDCCKDSCCDAKEEVKDDCCSPPSEVTQDNDSCKDACCSTSKSDEVEPSCCQGKQKPCCDSTCIDRLVLRETSFEKRGDDSTINSSQNSSSPKAKSIRERYETRLAALGCLCRALVALGQESCCATSELSSEERKRGPKKSVRRRSQEKLASACNSKSGGCCSKPPKRKPSPSGSQRSKSCKKGCCGGTKENISITPVDDCCSGGPAPAKSKCQQDMDIIADKKGNEDIRITSLEKGLSGTENVVIGISGMTCTGCETKLRRTLGDVKALNNLKTSLVMARVQFQLDLSLATPEDVMKHIERTTEFKCERIVTHGSTLDVIPHGGAKEFMKQSLPLGVENLDLIDDQTVRIIFDPEVIGARDLINKGFDTPPNLAPPQVDPSLAAGSKHVRHMGWMTLLSAALTVPVLVLAWAPLEDRPVTYGSVSLALATIVQVVIAGPFYPKALKSLVFSRVVEMDLLIVLSTTAAYVFSVVSFGYQVSGQPLSTGNFFETSTLLVTLIMVGRWVSALARQKAVESISIRTLQASTATLVSSDGTETDIDTRLLQYGDIFKVAPHAQVPTDGVILSGVTETDESMLTGESRPVEKKQGSTIIAGSLNGSGTITARLTKLPGENTISAIAGMVDDAKLSKPKIQDLADRVASYFVPVIISLTLIVFVAWIGVGIRNQGKSGNDAVVQAITYAITVLIVSCPCAIGLAVPMVIVIACGVAAEKGLVFKTSEAVEIAHKTTHIVFDKTGTLTHGKLFTATEEYLSETQKVVAPKILGLLANINHPVSSAVAAHLKSQGVHAVKVDEIQSLPGKGVQGKVNGISIQAGNPHWLGLESHPVVQAARSKDFSTFCVTINSELQAVFGLTDTVRPDVLVTIAELQKRNISVSILSGDDDRTVEAVAAAVGIPRENAISRCSPADKQAYIQKLLETGSQNSDKKNQKKPVVVFVGDGTNDAVALAQATIGVHVNSGVSDVAQSAADVVLMRPDLAGVLAMIDISRAAVHRVVFNFGWSAVYNVFAILLAAGAFADTGREVRIPPEFAGLGELVSVLPVIVVAVSLRWARV
ncbi:heavy metal translocatin [Annulohypoxylon maeteangense]|uniref:heavy metal translocatin n=1 Tax=Annulohypoxylon maeteangense TaxID=1927788 RepID=UPI0020087DBC|nr:heavy metal translocatin [Annulohypoxylon maeteangense]KAI0882802.1 heavy metal translocatin [Annulohypoxylon maeteangense]